ncbi:hypothetical protein H2198_006573, partial [Neophaeococcomyces mojaviensis]
MSTTNDGSESVDDFLARIANVKEGRDEADEARTRRMEEEILKSRKERQARRAERARSLSPSKTGPAQVASPMLDSPTKDRALNPPVDFSPQSKTLSRSKAVTGRASPTKDPEIPSSRPPSFPDRANTPSHSQTNTAGLTRSGTLSWQQRPTSRDGAPSGQRPLSSLASIRSPPPESSKTDSSEEPSRKDIAASLAQKDPTWFRQTQDRGLNSAAYRKSQVEDGPTDMPTSKSMQLPGMSQHRAPSKSPTPDDRTLQATPPVQSISQADSDRFKRGNTPDIAALRNSMVIPPTQLRPTSQESYSSRPLSLNSSSNTESTAGPDRSSSILSSNRSPSPTKGLGGFVESAMMKRSDSVNKRWSVKANSGLKRGDSVASGRPPSSLHTRGLSRDAQTTRDNTPSSPLASSRPGSSHVQNPVSSPVLKDVPSKVEQQENVSDRDASTNPITESAPPAEQTISRPTTPPNDSQLARSPSKTMDSRRWSPTKSTWLESALQAGTEPPKIQPLKEAQPKWKVDLQRSRSKANRDVSPDKTKQPDKEPSDIVKPLSLRRSETNPATVQNATPPALKEQRERPPSLPKPNGLKASKTSDSTALSAPTSDQSKDIPVSLDVSEEDVAVGGEKEEVKEPIVSEVSEVSEKKPPAPKPKPQTPPKTDFRATLRSRTPGPTPTTDKEPEFKSIFGKLKRTTTQNYVAPDELKSNILSGKAALNITEGPQKTKRVDEFKESILAKKEEMKTSVTKPTQQTETKEKPEAPVPEALARRKTLSKASAPNLAKAVFASQPTPSKPEVKPKVALKSMESSTPPTLVKQGEELPTRSTPAVAPVRDTAKTSESWSYKETPTPTAASSADSQARLLPDDKAASAKSGAVVAPSVGGEAVLPAKASFSPGMVEKPLNTGSSSRSVAPAVTTTGGISASSKLASRLNPNLAAMLS